MSLRIKASLCFMFLLIAASASAADLKITGHVKFNQDGDIVSPRIDFHRLWIGPPNPPSKGKKRLAPKL
jgi:hypothetical protein